MRKVSPVSPRVPSIGPLIVGARPARLRDAMAIADMARQIVLLDHLAHIGQDLFGPGDGRADPRLEAIAEGVEVAVGADAGITMHPPGAAEALQPLEHDKAPVGALLFQMIGGADAGNPGADDQHVEMFGLARLGRVGAFPRLGP